MGLEAADRLDAAAVAGVELLLIAVDDAADQVGVIAEEGGQLIEGRGKTVGIARTVRQQLLRLRYGPALGAERIDIALAPATGLPEPVVHGLQHLLLRHGRRVDGLLKKSPEQAVQLVVAAGHLTALIILPPVDNGVDGGGAPRQDQMHPDPGKELPRLVRRKGFAVRPGLDAVLENIVMRDERLGDIGIPGVLRRDVQDHPHGLPARRVYGRAAEDAVQDPRQLAAADRPGGIGIPVGAGLDPAAVGGCTEYGIELILRLQVAKGDLGIGFRVKAAEHAQQLVARHGIVRIEEVPLQYAQILQRGGRLAAAVVLRHVQEFPAAHEADVQQPVKRADRLAYGDLGADVHHAVFVRREIGNMLFRFQGQGVACGIDRVGKDGKAGAILHAAVRTLPAEKGVAVQLDRVVQPDRLPVGHGFDRVFPVRHQIAYLTAYRRHLFVQKHGRFAGGVQVPLQPVGSLQQGNRDGGKPCKDKQKAQNIPAKRLPRFFRLLGRRLRRRRQSLPGLCRGIFRAAGLPGTGLGRPPHRVPAGIAALGFQMLFCPVFRHAVPPSGRSEERFLSTISRMTVSA